MVKECAVFYIILLVSAILTNGNKLWIGERCLGIQFWKNSNYVRNSTTYDFTA